MSEATPAEAPAVRAPVDPEQWVDLYGDYLYKYALLRLRDPSTARDAVQETFLGALKGLDRFDGRVDIKYWLRGILRNKIVDQINRQAKEVQVEDFEAAEFQNSLTMKAFGVPFINPDPWHFNARKAFEQKEFLEVFRQCVGKLKGTMLQAFTLKMLEDMPTEEVCKILGVTPNNLWVITHRARGQLKTCLEKNWKELA